MALHNYSYIAEIYSDVVGKQIVPENIKFKAILTGANDSLPDYEYQLKNYNGTHYSGRTSYLNFSMPYSQENLQALIDRPNGEIQLIRIAELGDILGEEIIAVGNPQSNNFYQGVLNASMTIAATKQITNVDPKTYDLENVISVNRNTDNKRVFEVFGYNSIKPGDSFIYQAETILSDQIVILISATVFKYKIREG